MTPADAARIADACKRVAATALNMAPFRTADLDALLEAEQHFRTLASSPADSDAAGVAGELEEFSESLYYAGGYLRCVDDCHQRQPLLRRAAALLLRASAAAVREEREAIVAMGVEYIHAEAATEPKTLAGGHPSVTAQSYRIQAVRNLLDRIRARASKKTEG